ncbi:MAG: class I tRNA ligase family protein, partial [Desulfitobacterium sp.]|nr:class I tRNA ligase family protein [Desulfitobacterium sp.]
STSVAAYGVAPYKGVLTHGFLVDEKGRKMSKSLGNGVDPLQVVNQMGADILRLWVCSADYKNDVAASPRIMKQMSEAYRKIRNTLRFLLGNLTDFDPSKDQVPYEELSEIDRWALLQYGKVTNRVLEGYEKYEFHWIYHALHNFCVVEMSAIYLDIVKDRLYVEGKTSPERRATQTVLYEILHGLVRLMAPVLTFTADEIWSYIPGVPEGSNVQVEEMPKVNPQWFDEALEEKWDKLLAVRSEVTKALEGARQDKLINHPLTAQVDLYPDAELEEFLKGVPNLDEIFIVSHVNLHGAEAEKPENAFVAEDVPLSIGVQPAPGEKCERCWIFHTEVGKDEEHPHLCPRCTDVVKN